GGRRRYGAGPDELVPVPAATGLNGRLAERRGARQLTSEGAVPRPWLVDPRRGTRRDEIGDQSLRRCSTLVPGNVGVVSLVEIPYALSRRPNDRSTRRIIGLIES